MRTASCSKAAKGKSFPTFASAVVPELGQGVKVSSNAPSMFLVSALHVCDNTVQRRTIAHHLYDVNGCKQIKMQLVLSCILTVHHLHIDNASLCCKNVTVLTLT